MARRYQMTRIEAGDYLLPSNDGETLWRLSIYEDDKTLDGTVVGVFWGLWRRPFPKPCESIDLIEWSGWEPWSMAHRTRGEAIDAAISAD